MSTSRPSDHSDGAHRYAGVERDHVDSPEEGGQIISGHGDEVPDQTEGGLIMSGHGDEVPNQTEGGRIISGHGDEVPDGSAAGHGDAAARERALREEQALEDGREHHGRHRAEDV